MGKGRKVCFSFLVLIPAITFSFFWFRPKRASPRWVEKSVSAHAPSPTGATGPDPLLLLHSEVPTEKIVWRLICVFYQKDQIDVRVVFGYKDSRPARFVGDRYERAYFVQEILKMGFSRAREDDDLFTLELQGPDGREKTILLRLVSSSTGPDDDENKKDPFQRWKSDHALASFNEGLEKADAVFYDGHSRNGGGPDFESPRCGASLHVDYAWYENNRPGLKRLRAALKKGKPGAQLIGLFSCVSDRHFADSIFKIRPQTAVMGTNALIYYADALEALSSALRNLLEMKCKSEFVPAGTQLRGFFKK